MRRRLWILMLIMTIFSSDLTGIDQKEKEQQAEIVMRK